MPHGSHSQNRQMKRAGFSPQSWYCLNRGLINMSHRSVNALAFILASLALAGVVRAQQPNADDAAKAQSGPAQSQVQQSPTAETVSPSDHASPSTPPPAASKPPALTTIVVNGGPSSDILRSARNAGFKIKIANGTTHFCKTAAPLGSRFASESCMNEQQVTLFLSRAQDQRDTLTHIVGAPAAAP
jgi:hypothetical protein